MSPVDLLRRVLAEPRLEGVDLESENRIEIHSRILSEKRMLLEAFDDLYARILALDDEHFRGEGLRVELGAGVSRLKQLRPDIMTTDVVSAPHLDRVMDAEHTGLGPESVRAFYAINCFHHFRSPTRFFDELRRVLRPGGGCILVEPYHGPLAALLYTRVFDSEDFDKQQTGWEHEGGVMTDANQALSWIVFERDRTRLAREFPDLEVAHQERVSSYLRYLLSGGLNFRQLVPDLLIGPLRTLERWLSPLDRLLALHHVIVLRKRCEDTGASQRQGRAR